MPRISQFFVFIVYNLFFSLPYRYRFEELFLHWGTEADDGGGNSLSSDMYGSSGGSEHSIDKYFFPAEIQLYGFNVNLKDNLTDAIQHPHGAVAISVMVQEGDGERSLNSALRGLAKHFEKVRDEFIFMTIMFYDRIKMYCEQIVGSGWR